MYNHIEKNGQNSFDCFRFYTPFLLKFDSIQISFCVYKGMAILSPAAGGTPGATYPYAGGNNRQKRNPGNSTGRQAD